MSRLVSYNFLSRGVPLFVFINDWRFASFLSILLIATGVFAAAVTYGSFVAGGSDSYGYLSQARLWEHGLPIVSEPIITEVHWPLADWTFSPLGYKPGLKSGTIVPTYSVGYPILMAAFGRGLRTGTERFVVPLTAAGLVVCTALMGIWVAGPVVGILASVLVATSPAFVLQSLQPMSDVPTAFWWTFAAVAGLSKPRVFTSVVLGIAVVFAILTRPNLLPLGLPLALFVLVAKRREETGYNWVGAVAILTGMVVGGGVSAYLDTIFFGGPSISGYGAPHDLYKFNFWAINGRNYLQWIVQSESPLILLSGVGLFALFLAKDFSRRWSWYAMAVMGILLLSYLFYTPFDNWTYVRFLLPAYPFVFIAVLCSVNIRVLRMRRHVSTISLAILTFLLVYAHLGFIVNKGLLRTKDDEMRYVNVADYVRDYLPGNAVLICAQHSGSIRYYTNRTILRYDWLLPNSLDDAVYSLQELGYRPYFLLEDWEEPAVRSRFGLHSAFGKLDWQASAEFRRYGVRIYDPLERAKRTM